MGIAKEVWETDRMPDELAISLSDAAVVGIGDDAGAVVNDFNPFGFVAQDDARLLKEESLFLHAAAVGHNNAGILLQHVDFKE